MVNQINLEKANLKEILNKKAVRFEFENLFNTKYSKLLQKISQIIHDDLTNITEKAYKSAKDFTIHYKVPNHKLFMKQKFKFRRSKKPSEVQKCLNIQSKIPSSKQNFYERNTKMENEILNSEKNKWKSRNQTYFHKTRTLHRNIETK